MPFHLLAYSREELHLLPLIMLKYTWTSGWIIKISRVSNWGNRHSLRKARVGFPHTFTWNKTHCYDISITEGINIAEAEQIVMKWLIIAHATWDGTPTWVTDRSADTHSLGIVWHVRHLQKKKKSVLFMEANVDLTEWHKWESPLEHSGPRKKWRLHMFNWNLIRYSQNQILSILFSIFLRLIT